MIRFATFNIAFDRPLPSQLRAQLTLPPSAQDALLARCRRRDPHLTRAEQILARDVQQIRNVAEIIQRTRPDVLLLNEFDNDGNGGSNSDLEGFNHHYLAHPQHREVTAIRYPHQHSFATNTGLMSGHDLNLDGRVNSGPEDAWGFGSYHGQYAFAVLSRYPVDTRQIRTFQHFKWHAMPGERNPVIDHGNRPDNRLPALRQPGDPWYEEAVWQQYPLSSKNHVDLPIRIPNGRAEEVIHFLIAHPTPPIFANAAGHNVKHNRAEIAFWQDYIESAGYMVDDQGRAGGLAPGSRFVIGGDLNADPSQGAGDPSAIRALLQHPLINQAVTRGSLIPTSQGGPQWLANQPTRSSHPTPARITSSSGLQLDHLLPSSQLDVVASGVFWPASDEPGYHLVHHRRRGIAKGVSSDHRLVWIDIQLAHH